VAMRSSKWFDDAQFCPLVEDHIAICPSDEPRANSPRDPAVTARMLEPPGVPGTGTSV